MYIKYKLQKKQVSHDGGVTWVDVVPLEERVGESAGTYSTLEECEGDYSKEYLTIESLEDGNVIYWNNANSAITKTISASTDNGQTWTAYTSSTVGSGTTIATLNTGDKVLLKGINSTYASDIGRYNRFLSTKKYNVYGNIMSLLYGDSFVDKTLLQLSYTFQRLFHNTNVVDASNLILPATTLMTHCYWGMFADCTNLTTAPELPATALYAWCYQNMFSGCTSLTAAPELPATALAERCYGGMFYGCTSLTAAPELPATTLTSYCYMSMFEGCTSLTTAPELPATALAYYCYNNMFNGCTSLTTAPELPATTLASRCYYQMFIGCTSLNYIKCLATDISATYCTREWVTNVAALGTFVKASSMGDWTSGTDGIPNSWTVQNA